MNSAKSALLARNSPLVHDALSQTQSVARAYQEAQEDLFFFFFTLFQIISPPRELATSLALLDKAL